MLPTCLPLLLIAALSASLSAQESSLNADLSPLESASSPNIILILADDLGYGELGSNGQTKIRTPRLDRLAAEGLRFTQAYSGAPVCAPARCVLLTGQRSDRAEIRGNKEVGGWGPREPEGQWPITDASVTLAELVGAQGYATGVFGKWGLGGPGSSGHPNAQGFERFYGYLCQRVAHNYYPTHLWDNHNVHVLGNRSFAAHQRVDSAPEDFARFLGTRYAPDEMQREALSFVREHAEQPFFLYLPLVEPHVAMQPPQEWVERYPAEWDAEGPYLGDKGYLPHPRPRAGYAAMISDMDENIGALIDLVDELGLGENTLILFSSDNGPTHDVGGVDTSFFDSTAGLRGRKGSVYEGGLRVPMLARWTGRIAAGRASDHVLAFEDVMATLAELLQIAPPASCDGLSFLPTLLERGEQAQHDALLWEFHGYGGQKAARLGRWKVVQRDIHKGNTALQLYDLASDPGETRDVATEHPELLTRARELFAERRTPNEQFPMPSDSKTLGNTPHDAASK